MCIFKLDLYLTLTRRRIAVMLTESGSTVTVIAASGVDTTLFTAAVVAGAFVLV